MGAFYEIVRITEDEMREMIRKDTQGYPKYYCVTRAGTILTHPRFDPDRMQLYSWGEMKPLLPRNASGTLTT